MGRMLLHGRCYGFRRRVNSAAPHDLVAIIDDADRSFLQGYIKADILVALGHRLAPLALQGPARYQSRDYPMSRPYPNKGAIVRFLECRLDLPLLRGFIWIRYDQRQLYSRHSQ
jgi:hypothetical protein